VAAETAPPTATDHKQQTRRVPRWLVVLAALTLAGVVVGVIVYGYLARPGWIGVSGKKFWDYLELLIVPTALAVGVYWLNRVQSERERKAEETQQERELEVENRRTQDAALQAYLDQISQLLTDKERPLRRARPGDNLSVVARARTLTVLTRLDRSRKASVVQFLYESGLITKGRVVVDLSGADLRGAVLYQAFLDGANLSGASLSEAQLIMAKLRVANLRETNLFRANLSDADLSAWHGVTLDRTNLRRANLSQANLFRANLSQAHLHQTNLREGDLRGADLSEARLMDADLSGVDLRGADLSNAVFAGYLELGLHSGTEILVQQTKFLSASTTMPNGMKYAEWLKAKLNAEEQLAEIEREFFRDERGSREDGGE
jgi:hypothetical protein